MKSGGKVKQSCFVKKLRGENLNYLKNYMKKYFMKICQNLLFGDVFPLSEILCEIKQCSITSKKSYLPKRTQNGKLF